MIDRTGAGTANRAGADALASAVHTLLLALPGTAPFLRGWPTRCAERSVFAHSLPVLAWLATARASAIPSTVGLVEMLEAQSRALAWDQTYTMADVGAAFLDRYGWTELIGTCGPIASDALAVGILVLGPETHYPAHAHAAEELYIPLAGIAAWMRGSEGYVDRPPGTVIHHAPWVPHAMRTSAEPLLAVYVWQGGDLAARSRLVA